MLRRSRRLSTEQFNEVIKKGKAFHSLFFQLRISRNPGEPTRAAAVAPVKMAKKAVARNDLRRRIYEIVSPLLPDSVVGYHVIVFAKPTLLPAGEAKAPSDAAVVEDLKALFVKAGILR